MSAPTVGDLFERVSPTADAVAAARLSLCAAALDAPQRLGPWTDEELAGLDEPGRAPSAPSPWFSSLSPAEQDVALTAALRGLTARGVYRAEPVDEATGVFTYRAVPELLALLTMRRHTDHVVVAERRGAAQVDWTVLYEQRAGLWLLEQVDHVGLHEFLLCTAEEAADRLTGWSGAHDGPSVPDLDLVLTRAQVAARDDRLGAVGRSTLALTLTRLDVADPSAQRSSGLFTGPGGCVLSTAAPGGDAAYRGVDVSAVRGHWADLLAPR
jgi:hypothetical protein